LFGLPLVTWLAIFAPGAAAPAPDGRNEMARCLERARQASGQETWEWLRKAVLCLENGKDITDSERREYAEKVAAIMRARSDGTKEIQRVVGPSAKKQIARQILYRRCIEYWKFEAPIPLWVSLERRKGQEGVVRMIRCERSEN